ncbi:sigma 54-interacting transcriptional regulator [Sorangium sp. So ce1389]|uniref:sigma 54-interacting transcriptional regulator n=1 Tax=Sorangium sp. So ce1389 TaxID=3133336 RepID=UPI003F5EA1C0
MSLAPRHPRTSAPPAPSTGAAVAPPITLAVFAGDELVVHALPREGRVSIGRSSDNDIWINHPSVSRRHAVLHLDPPLRLEDLGGANGTYIRSARAPVGPGEETHPLQPISRKTVEVAVGDSITLGTAMLAIRRDPGEAAAGQPPPARRAGAEIVVRAPVMQALHQQVDLVSKSLISVLLLGETGVGKEVLARAIHDSSPRASRPFLALNCAALSESLLESELFGHEKGAFTGAIEARPGLFESAAGGTVFLDELGELPQPTQVKLLRVIEARQVLRVGGRAPRSIDVRFVSATNRDLEAEMERGAFRQDLFFRLNGVALTIPPLRERVAEIAPLAEAFADSACRLMDRPRPPLLSAAVRSALERYPWPGNVRELRHVIERAVVLCAGETLLLEHLPDKLRDRGERRPAPGAPGVTDRAGVVSAGAGVVSGAARDRERLDAEARERERIIAALEACGGNQTHAAAQLGISRRTLINRLEAFRLPRPRKKS